MTQSITLLSRKVDGSLHRTGEVVLLGEEPDGAWRCYHAAGRRIQTGSGEWHSIYPMISWRWPNRWWDAALVFTPEGEWLEWYCNILTPPHFDGRTMTSTDLDVDVVLHRERGLLIEDLDEMEQHAAQMAYPPELVARIHGEAQSLYELMATGGWRFGDPVTDLTLELALACYG